MKNFIKIAMIAVALTAFAVLFAAILPTSAETEAIDGNFTYTVSGGTATITGFPTSYEGALEIPSTLGGYPVASIGNRAFNWCSGITDIIIPDSVINIGEDAFAYCYGFTIFCYEYSTAHAYAIENDIPYILLEKRPEDTNFEATEPEAIESESAEPEGTEPEETQPEETESKETHPEETRSEGTEAAENNPADTESKATDPEKKSGCASSVGVGALLIASLLGVSVAFKKKENEE